MSAGAPPIVVVGSINVDQVVQVDRHPSPGETLIGSGLVLLPGGKGANQAVAAARLGADVLLVGAVGSDQYAATATALLASDGVDISGVATVPGPTGLALITVAGDGENTIVVVPGANAAVDAAFVRAWDESIRRAPVVVLQGEIPASGAAAAARSAEGRLVLNLAPVIDLDPAVILAADPLVVNEHEAGLLLAQLGRDVPADDVEKVQSLRDAGIRSVVLTRGKDGAICSDDSGTQALPAPAVSAVDTSGAGDAFVGALAGVLAGGASLQDATAFAVRVGAYAVQSAGTQPSYPRPESVLPGDPS